jgi:type IV pilus assembly protein PilQ
MIKRITLILLFSLFSKLSLAQQSQMELENRLTELAKQKKGLTEILKIDVSGLNLKDFVTAIAEQHQLNIDIDSDLNQPITNNFFDVTVKDVLLYIAEKYDLEFGFLNNIITIRKKKEIKIVEKKLAKIIDVSYNPQNDFLSVKIENDTLSTVAKAITEKSGKNIVLSSEIKTAKVSAYILNRPFDQVIEMMAKSNDLVATRDENGFFFLQKNKEPQAITENITQNSSGGKTKRPKPTVDADGFYEVEINKTGFLNVKANVADAADLLKEAADKLHISYFLYNKPENEKTSLAAENITFDDLLNHIFKGKKYTYKQQNDL